jgi:1-acyl-sn-glycerol-3-phosphate acyltransferase
MSNFFLKIFNFFQQRKALLYIVLFLFVGLLTFSASRISFVEDISSFLPNSTDNKRINDAYQHIGAANKIIVRCAYSDVRCETNDSSVAATRISEIELSEVATRFTEILSELDSADHIKKIIYEVDNEKISQVADFITQNLPYFLEEADYARIDSLIQPQAIEKQLKINKNLLMSPMGGFVRNMILNDPLHFSQKALKNLEIFKLNDSISTDNGFIFNTKGECLVTITSKYPVSETANNKLLAEKIYTAINHTQIEFDNKVKITPFGAALISITNAEQIKSDSFFAISIALILTLALLFYFFRNVKSLFFIALSVVFGALFSIGVIVLFKDTVSIIAIGIASIIFGIAINYPLHFLAHLKHSISEMRNTECDKNQETEFINRKSKIVVFNTLKEIVNPLLIGNITTVGAFLSLLFISSDAMKDLGLFSSLLLVGTIVFVLIFLPQIIAVRQSDMRYATSGRQELQIANHKSQVFGKLADFSPEKNKLVVFIFLIFTIVLFFFSFGTKFDANMQVINYMTTEQRAEMDKLIEENKGKGKTVYVVAEGKNTEEALQNYEKEVEPLIRQYELAHSRQKKHSGISNFFPSKELQQQKIDRWNEFWKDKKTGFQQNFDEAAKNQTFNSGIFMNFNELLNKNFQPQEFAYFALIYKDLGENYFSIDGDRTYVYTILNIPDTAMMASNFSFLGKLRGACFSFDDTSVAQKMVAALSDEFNSMLYICAFIVFVFLFFSFGRIEIAILTFIPMAVSWIWILGLMNIFSLKFNIVNIILATFIFGQGDDYAIFVTEGLIYEYTYRRKMLASFKNSIILSATILFIAIGMLIFAKHPALRSLAELTIVGMVSVVMCAYLFPSLIYRWLISKKGQNRRMPITLWSCLKTAISFATFIICSIIVTLIGFFILTIGGKTKKHKYQYHKFLYVGFRFLSKIIPQVRHKVHNLSGENFEKPAVIIANHQSHLDLLYILMLSPKIIVLTNKWVWNCPFYGWIIRYADFLPVADGIENNVERLRPHVEDGYSILVFPEGTRSKDCSIGRFHKGAFYLAEQLNLDILPIVTHGIGHFLSKQEFLMRKGQVDVEIHDRFQISNFPISDLRLTKISNFARKEMQDKYTAISRKTETPDYFADLVLKNYIYKGAKVERAVRKSLKKNKNFAAEIEKLPESGEIAIQNSGYGEFALMAALVHKNLNITAIEPDDDIRAVAENCLSKPTNLNFTQPVNFTNSRK